MERLLNIAITLLVIDLIWIRFVFGNTFMSMIQNIQKENVQINIIGVIIAYIALVYLAITLIPRLTILESFLVGTAIYAVYDFTNYSVFQNWDFRVAVVDTLWGGVLFTLLKVLNTE
jgi:uncharacterized membrane protein